MVFFTPVELSNHPHLGPLEGADGQEEGLRHRRQREVLHQLQLRAARRHLRYAWAGSNVQNILIILLKEIV